METKDKAKMIAELNDRFRQSFIGERVMSHSRYSRNPVSRKRGWQTKLLLGRSDHQSSRCQDALPSSNARSQSARPDNHSDDIN